MSRISKIFERLNVSLEEGKNIAPTLIKSWDSWVKVVNGELHTAQDIKGKPDSDWSVVDTPDDDFIEEVEKILKVKVKWKGHGHVAMVESISDDDLEQIADLMHNSIEHMDDIETEALKHISDNVKSVKKDDVVKFLKAETKNFLKGKYIRNKTEDDLELLRKYFK